MESWPFKELTPVQAVILAFTIDRPRYGYEIASRVEHGMAGSFLVNLDRSAVYKALETLERMGHIAALDHGCAVSRAAKRRCDTRRWHEATTQGREAHRHWLMNKLAPEPERTEILGRIASAARLGPPAIRTVLDECEQYCAERERALEAIQRLDAECPNLTVLCDRLVFIERKTALRGLREWIEMARDEVDSFAQQQAIRTEQRPARTTCV
ncbi:MAG: helix-turn-helix transcriptional regulator [Solirubrobacteraceae bacterium]